MAADAKELYARAGTAAVPKILGLLDRNPLRATYGCFDKSYWHYKTASFPSGMYQEYVLPLALVYLHRFPGGEEFQQQPNLKEWVRAGIRFAARSAHRDASCDDYFPYERALGATAFSLYAMTESSLLLELREAESLAFFERRGRWLAEHDEAGRLANHHALVTLALYNVHLLTQNSEFREAAQQRLVRVLDWQTEEGWFPEYEGCDPGYHTATIDFLAKYHRKSGDAQVLEPLRRAVRFAADFIHPDGSFGGVYGSRNTAIFFPHGFELLAPRVPEAGWIADRYLEGVRRGRRVFLEDDRLVGHLTYNHLQAALDHAPARLPWSPPAERAHLWKQAGLYVRRKQEEYAVVSVGKGGVVTGFTGNRLAYADSGLIAQQADGRTLVTHLTDRYEHEVREASLRIKGSFGYARQRVPTPLAAAIFHLGMITLGRFFSNTVRALLQKLLIVGKHTAPLTFQRTIEFGPPLTITDEIWDLRPSREGANYLTALYAGTDHTSIYVAMSNAYQPACLLPWSDLSAHLEELRATGYVKVRRSVATAAAPAFAARQAETQA